MDYKNGKIYKILNDNTDDVYVGSACQPLSKRMAEHRGALNKKACSNFKIYNKMKEIGKEHFYTELIEEFPCDNVEQLRAREGYYIRQIATLNKLVAGRTKEEFEEYRHEAKKEYGRKYRKEHCDAEKQKTYNEKYKSEHKEEIKDQRKKHYDDNKEEIKEKQMKYYVANRETRLDKMNEYRLRNVDKIKESHTCAVCGGKYQNKSKHAHFRTTKHQEALQKES